MGALVQLDASPFAWFEGRGPVLALHGAIDDATGTGLALYFRPAEDLHGYATLLHLLCTTYGLPLALYGDRLGVFVRNDPHWTLEEELRGTQDPTHFGRILQELGIGYIAAHSPKPRAASNASGKPCKIASSASCACADLHAGGGQRLPAGVPRRPQPPLRPPPPPRPRPGAPRRAIWPRC